MKTKIFFTVVFIFFVLNDAVSQEKPHVKVIFQILEKEYIDYYSKEELSNIQRVGSDSIASLFNQFIPVFLFVTNEQVSDSLMIQLMRRQGSSEYLFHIDWQASLRGKNVKPSNNYTWNFADASTFEEPLNDEPIVFVNYIYSELNRKFKQDINQTDFIDRIFRNIKLTQKVDSIDFIHKKWILPFTYEYLNIGWETKFKIDHILEGPDGVMFRPYECKAMGKHSSAKIILEAFQRIEGLSSASFKSLDGIYITYYNPYDLY